MPLITCFNLVSPEVVRELDLMIIVGLFQLNSSIPLCSILLHYIYSNRDGRQGWAKMELLGPWEGVEWKPQVKLVMTIKAYLCPQGPDIHHGALICLPFGIPVRHLRQADLSLSPRANIQINLDNTMWICLD